MRIIFKITAGVLDAMRTDLARPHPFAHERVGFLTAGASAAGDALYLFGRSYRPVPDEHYVEDNSVGAMIGRKAFGNSMARACDGPSALFHVHTHGGRGLPQFSGIDLRESRRFVPSFFNAVPQMPHGVLLLSDSAARALVWLGPDRHPLGTTEVIRVGPIQLQERAA